MHNQGTRVHPHPDKREGQITILRHNHTAARVLIRPGCTAAQDSGVRHADGVIEIAIWNGKTWQLLGRQGGSVGEWNTT